MLDHEARVEKHADGHEENPAERVPKRQRVGHRLQAVLGFRNDEPRDEGTQRQGEAELGGHVGGAQTEEQDAQREQFAIAQADHAIENPRHEIASA